MSSVPALVSALMLGLAGLQTASASRIGTGSDAGNGYGPGAVSTFHSFSSIDLSATVDFRDDFDAGEQDDDDRFTPFGKGGESGNALKHDSQDDDLGKLAKFLLKHDKDHPGLGVGLRNGFGNGSGGLDTSDSQATPNPEPSTLGLLGLGLVAAVLARRNR